MKERVRFEDFEEALLLTDVVGTVTKANSDGLLKWVYNLVTTRSIETPSGDKIIAPMGDMVRNYYINNLLHILFQKNKQTGYQFLSYRLSFTALTKLYLYFP